MASLNHYETLGISSQATPAEVKQAYRQLVKLYHPDKNLNVPNSHDRIAQINTAYEVLRDPQNRHRYDRQLEPFRRSGPPPTARGRQQNPAGSQSYRSKRQTGYDADKHFQSWLKRVYAPVNESLILILEPLQGQIDQLAADPFDDQLMEEFQAYLQTCRHWLAQAQHCFHSMPNPTNLAGVAAHLYYCLNQVGDGVEDLEFFTLCYDDRYLHTGQELFRIARGLRWEAEDAIKNIA